MSEFKSLHGQSCDNCRCLVPEGYAAYVPVEGKHDDGCALGPYLALCPRERWCGSWRPGAAVRCGGCKWHERAECPRTATGQPLGERGHVTFFIQTCDVAFACERWESEGAKP